MGLEEPPNPAHLRLKAGTAVATVAITLGLLLFDWNSSPGTGGQPNVFSSVRPAVKAVLSRYWWGHGGQQGQPSAQSSSSSKEGSR